MRFKLISVILVGLLLIAVGCGSSKKSAESTTNQATTEAMTTESMTETTTGTTSGMGLTSSECQKLEAASQTISKAFSGSMSSGIDQEVAKLEALSKIAPDEIKGDFAVLADAAQKYSSLGIKPGETPTPAQLQKLAALSSQLNITEVQASAMHIMQWAQTNCTTTSSP